MGQRRQKVRYGPSHWWWRRGKKPIKPEEAGGDPATLRRSVLKATSAAAFLSVVSLSAAGAAGGASGKPVLTILTAPLMPFSATFDPTQNQNTPHIWPLTYAPMIHVNADGSLSPALATAWHYLKPPANSLQANKGFEFTLRHDARFSDGTPVTAQAVVSWFNYAGSKPGQSQGQWGSKATYKTVGKWSVIVHLQSPNPTIAQSISDQSQWGFVASPACVADQTKFTSQACGAGPYEVVPSQTVGGDHVTLVPNPYYYDKSSIKWSKIIIKGGGTASSSLQALEAGQADVAFGDPSTADAAKRAGLTVVGAETNVVTLFFDVKGVKVPALADVRVRQALNYGTNRKVIAAALFGKYGAATDEVASSDGQDPKYANYYAYNPAKAKALLAAAGYGNGLTIEAVAYGQGFSDGPTLSAVAKQLSAIGVTLKVTLASTIGELVNDIIVDPFPIFVIGTFNGGSMWSQYSGTYAPGTTFNKLGGGYFDPVLEHLWITGSRAANAIPYWQQMTDRILLKAYNMPVASYEQLYYFNPKKAKGVVVSNRRLNSVNPLEWVPSR
jgi:peptide/nickel transport system substrate-binding protein